MSKTEAIFWLAFMYLIVVEIAWWIFAPFPFRKIARMAKRCSNGGKKFTEGGKRTPFVSWRMKIFPSQCGSRETGFTCIRISRLGRFHQLIIEFKGADLICAWYRKVEYQKYPGSEDARNQKTKHRVEYLSSDDLAAIGRILSHVA